MPTMLIGKAERGAVLDPEHDLEHIERIECELDAFVEKRAREAKDAEKVYDQREDIRREVEDTYERRNYLLDFSALELMGEGPDATPESIRAEQEEYDQEVAKIREGTP